MAENLHVADAREILRLKRELAKYTQISGRLLWEWHHDSSPRGDGLVEQIEELYEHLLANGGTLLSECQMRTETLENKDATK